MNIFDNTIGLFGEYKQGEQKELSNDFWNTAREIRQERGEDSYILDSYILETMQFLCNAYFLNFKVIVTFFAFNF